MSLFIDISIVENVNTKLYWNALTSHTVLQCQVPEEGWPCVYRWECLRNRRF